MRRTHALVQVSLALLADPTGCHWGYDLSRRAGVRSGVMYPLLTRMLESGWLSDGWEPENEAIGRPPRRYYELTDVGRKELGALVAEAQLDSRFIALFRWA
jgi:PadR family transcriptional regulator PadR